MKALKISVLLFVCLFMLFAACKKECTHQYQSTVTQQATCTQEGIETFTCTLCQHSYTAPVSILEHSYAPGVIQEEPTCTKEGLQIYACIGCGIEKPQPIEKLPHVLGDATITKAANCTQVGEQIGTCTVCATEQVTVEIPTNDVHTFVNTVSREATCTDPGEGINTCSLCQYSEPCQYELKEHSYNVEIIKKATCTKKGKQQLTCSHCGYSIEKQVDATGHKWTGASCTTAGVCSVCKAKGKKTNHSYKIVYEAKNTSTFAGKRTKECTTCSKQKTEYFTSKKVFDLDAIASEVAAYAKKKGFQVRIGTVDKADYRYSKEVFWLENNGDGPKKIISGAKKCVDYAYNDYAGSPAGIGAYTLVIHAYYTQSGSLGGGLFAVSIDVTS